MVKEREILKLPGKVFDTIRYGISWGLLSRKKSTNPEADINPIEAIDKLETQKKWFGFKFHKQNINKNN